MRRPPWWLVVVLVAILAFVLWLMWAQFPVEVAMVERLADIAVLLEGRTTWSYAAISDFVLLLIVIVLLIVYQVLSYLTQLLEWIVRLLLSVAQGRFPRPRETEGDRPPWWWIALAFMAWLMSLAVVKIMAEGGASVLSA
jgi:hypothetical protein